MNNWGWPQWAILFFLLIGELSSICRSVDKAMKSQEEIAEEAILSKRTWKSDIFSHAFLTVLFAYTLAKGGFW